MEKLAKSLPKLFIFWFISCARIILKICNLATTNDIVERTSNINVYKTFHLRRIVGVNGWVSDGLKLEQYDVADCSISLVKSLYRLHLFWGDNLEKITQNQWKMITSCGTITFQGP